MAVTLPVSRGSTDGASGWTRPVICPVTGRLAAPGLTPASRAPHRSPRNGHDDLRDAREARAFQHQELLARVAPDADQLASPPDGSTGSSSRESKITSRQTSCISAKSRRLLPISAPRNGSSATYKPPRPRTGVEPARRGTRPASSSPPSPANPASPATHFEPSRSPPPGPGYPTRDCTASGTQPPA